MEVRMELATRLEPSTAIRRRGHSAWVRLLHWMVAAAVLMLATSGFVILQAHPRLYWGQTGNDLTPALIELPMSRNYRHGGWAAPTPFYPSAGSPASAVRTYDIYNQNGWARSLHFLAAWLLVLPGAVFLLTALMTRHLQRDLLPAWRELRSRSAWRGVLEHLQAPSRPVASGPPYGLLQKIAYSLVVCVLLPIMLLTGLTMSPAVTAAWPWLQAIFNGTQSARTIHFAVFALIVLFIVGHVVMVLRSGFARQIRGMTIGE
jgi:thiosulfate reductase cytochrome b subunit